VAGVQLALRQHRRSALRQTEPSVARQLSIVAVAGAPWLCACAGKAATAVRATAANKAATLFSFFIAFLEEVGRLEFNRSTTASPEGAYIVPQAKRMAILIVRETGTTKPPQGSPMLQGSNMARVFLGSRGGKGRSWAYARGFRAASASA
jgi:hypothetical protein